MLLWESRTKTSCSVTLGRTCMAGFLPDGGVHVFRPLTGKMLPLSLYASSQRCVFGCMLGGNVCVGVGGKDKKRKGRFILPF